MTARKRLVIAVAVLLVVYWAGVAGYVVIDRDMGLLDAIYMVTITLSTVGHREVAHNSPAIKSWTILLIMVGSLSVAVVLASVAGVLVEGELGRLFGSRKVEARIKQLSGHAIVCGFGRMGSLLVGKSIREADIRRLADVMVVAIRRADGSTRFNPAADEVVREGDRLITIGPAGAALRLAKMRLVPEALGGDTVQRQEPT